MKNKIKVSIITPCLNSEKTIQDTIKSVLNQTYENIEYIIVDGGSTDDTMCIVKEYEPLFCGRMRYVSEHDSGIYNAMNKGLRMSHGQLIGIINSDDFYEKDAVSLAVAAMVEDACQMIYGYCRVLGRNGETVYINRESHANLFEHIFQHPTCFVTRQTYCKYGMFNEKFKVAADCDFIYRLYQKKVTFTQIKEITANYRVGGYSGTHDHRNELALIKYLNHGIKLREFIYFLIRNVMFSNLPP